VVNYKR